MTAQVKELRKRIDETRVDRRGYKIYSKELRNTLCDYAIRRAAQGAEVKQIAGELGMAAVTLQNWLRSRELATKEVGKPVGFRPVEVPVEQAAVSESSRQKFAVAPATGPSLVMPNGIRIEGLSMTQLTMLLDELGCY